MKNAYTGLLYSQVGYELGWPMKAIVRGPDASLLSKAATFQILEQTSGVVVLEGPLSNWGGKWGSCWWIADFSAFQGEGSFIILIRDRGQEKFRSEPFEIGKGILWRKTWKMVAIDQNERRSHLAMNRVGWQDCGASWQEANSHTALIDGFCDLLEYSKDRIPSGDLKRLEAQIVNGCDYLSLLQDHATKLGLGEGALSHQKPRYEEVVLPGDVSKAVMVWARASRMLSETHAAKRQEYLGRSEKAFKWLKTARPIRIGFSHINHGAPKDFVVPDEWTTRDLMMMCWAAFELTLCGHEEYRADAVALASKIMRRQVPRTRAEDGLFGHFYTFDTSDLTEKAWVHNVDKNELGMDAGGHYPYYLIPLLRMIETWPEHPDAQSWKRTVEDFAYGYFLPACKANPFYLLPLGYFKGTGLLWFSGLWHGMNGAYLLAAVLAQEFEKHFGDPAFREITAGNLQWIAGLNAGLTAEGVKAAHMFSADVPEGAAQPVSMIHGIGRHFAGSYMNIRGSICNGFSTGEQFKYDIEPSVESDGPYTFTDEDWITHSGSWLSAVSRLR
ncbi:MAG TPA: hypothetical protein DET40_03200 [Lentisphaeria bacterium]|nr:MAG: hypothetical protein A2X45_22290 [Lentisphaerae bacterium GWF2_50_93]HCE42538.1 hypothetical protein [Lentisphaeria bacterium]